MPAAKAALVALMQITKNAAAAISIVNLMAHSSLNCRDLSAFPPHPSTKPASADAAKSARSLHKNIPAQCTTMPPAVSIVVQDAYPLCESQPQGVKPFMNNSQGVTRCP